MWLRIWISLFITHVLGQQTHTRVRQGGTSFEWGWEQQRPSPGAAATGHYYVKLPQLEQRVQYSSDGNGYFQATVTGDHGTPAVAQATQLHPSQIQVQPQNYEPPNVTHLLPQGVVHGNTGPVEIYLLQQQFPSPSIFNDQLVQLAPNYQNEYPTNYIYNTQTPAHINNPVPTEVNFNVLTQHTQQNQRNAGGYEISNNYQKSLNDGAEHKYDPKSVVSVFKDHNCTDQDEAKASNVQTTQLLAQPVNNLRNINGNFGIRDSAKRPLTYRGAVNFRVEPQRENSRSERYYYTTESPTYATNDDGISKLVASTQDLISNEDLLRINHAIEKHVVDQSEDLLRPKPRYSLRAQQNQYSNAPRSRITVQAKIGNIVNSEIEHIENNESNEQLLQTSANEYKFASPIVVQDSSYNNYKEQIVNNLVSTMVPYIEKGYEIVGVSDGQNYTQMRNNNENSDENLVNVTPRPVGQNYLTPITVALRLLNANDTESLNTIDDHEGSDSEVIEEAVDKPQSERTLVEVQESIPVSITHINDVEVHEYMDEGRANTKGPLDYAKALYNKYMESLSNKNSNSNDNSYENSNSDENHKAYDGKDNVEPSENIQTEIQVRPNADNDRREYVRDFYNYDGEKKIIQPIIIEKEIPITQFVDRYIEKQVPYPEPVAVKVPVDRPVAVPIPYEKIVEKPVEVTRFVDKPYPVEVPRPYPVEVKVPYPVQQKVYVDRPVHIPYPVEKLVEQQVIHRVPVPTPVAVPYEVPVQQQVLYPVPIETRVPYPVEVDRPVEKIVTQQVPYPVAVEKRVPFPVPYETKVPVPYPVEKRVPVPVDRIVEKPVTITKYIDRPVRVEVPVPHPVPVAVPVAHPYPVDRIVEKKVPVHIPYDRIVEKKVQVPYPVEKIVEKIVEKPVYVTKYIDKPYPVEKRVPYAVEKIVEKKVPYAVHVPYEVKVPYAVETIVEKEVPVKIPADKPLAIYNYAHASDTQNYPQYLKYTADQHRQGIPPPHIQNQVQKQQAMQYAQYYHNLKNNQQKNAIKSTHWGNLYASSYQHINNTGEFKKSPTLVNYLNYVTNNDQSHNSGYYGPPPMENYNDLWEKNKNYVVELKLRRTDRMPKVSSLNIEYGFKPPLIPSTEVDLDGMPVKKNEQQ